MPEARVMNRWLVVLGAVLIQLCLGVIYAWSVFTPALIKGGWSKLETQIVFAVGLAVFAIVMVWAGRKLPVWGPRRLAWLGGTVLGLGYALAGAFGGTHFWSVTLFIGVIGGAGIGIGYVVPIAVGMRWFPDKRGLITGLAVAGFGFGAMLWVKLAGNWGQLIAHLGLSATFTIYGVAFAALVLVGGIWMVYPPEGWLPKGYTPLDQSDKGRVGSGQRDFTAGQMLETPQFYLIFLTFVISAGAGLMSIGLMKLYPIEAMTKAGIDQATASGIAGTAMAVFFSIANGLGRIAWGVVSDRIGRKRSILIMATTQGFFVMAFTFMAGNEYLLYVGATLIGFNFGGNFALFPTITADTFGTQRVGQNYPFVFLAYGVGGIAGPIMGGVLGDMGNFPLAFTVCGMACIVGAGCISQVRPPRSSEAPEGLEPEDMEPRPGAVVQALTHRNLEDADVESIVEFPQSPREVFHMFPAAGYPLTPETFSEAARERRSPTVVLAGGEVAGYANFISCHLDGLCVVGNVVVDPEHRRQGVGEHLMRIMCDKARIEYGARRIRASVFTDNTMGLLFYQRLGFRPVDMEQRKDNEGKRTVLLHLEKELEEAA